MFTKCYFCSESEGPHQLDHACNAHCDCSADTYQPVCGMDGSIYFSPCYAGCNDDTQMMEGPMGPFTVRLQCNGYSHDITDIYITVSLFYFNGSTGMNLLYTHFFTVQGRRILILNHTFPVRL